MNWERIEQQWRTHWTDRLQRVERLSPMVHDFVEGVGTHADLVAAHPTPAVFAERLLLRRLSEEFRGVELLAVRGHGYQAMSASATLFEVAHMLVDLCGDDVVCDA